MASHKVPQDVESEDKLLGPLSLKQLIFAMIGIGFGYLTYFFFAKIHPISSIIWLPFMLFFLVMGLYQRKDQPVEVFLAAAIKYYFGARTKIWNQEAYHEHVLITVPEKIEHIYTKNFTGQEAMRRLDSLSSMMDSRGWSAKMKDDWQNPQLATTVNSSRLISAPLVNNAGMQSTSAQPIDVQDQNSSIVARTIDEQLSQATNTGRQHALQTMQQARSQPTATTDQSGPQGAPTYQKYPTAMHQKVVLPQTATTSMQPVAATASVQNEANQPISQPSLPANPLPAPQVQDQPMQQSTTQDISSGNLDNNQTVEISLHDN